MSDSFITAANSEFQLAGARFPVTGVNCYFLAYCDDLTQRAIIAKAKLMGANVIRAWAFLAVEQFKPGSVAFQHWQDGAFAINDGPQGLQRLDALIKNAEDMGVKLILPMVNHWEALGGMPTYVKQLVPGSPVTDFYHHPRTCSAYKEWVSYLLTRRNNLTGRFYYDEPAVMAWELTNEARCQVDGGREILLGWVAEMAAFVKQHDANHLLALGDEGHFHKMGSGHLYDGTYGVDWVANLAVDHIDFGAFHFYPQDWGQGGNLNFATRWIHDHVHAAAKLNKPALMEEFGLKYDNRLIRTAEDRDGWYANWLDTMRSSKGAGQLLWMLGYAGSDDTKGFVDDYVVYDAGEVPCLASFAAL